MNKSSRETFYRPEIDGMRGIAVIAVVLYHAKINLFGYDIFKGGFLGVDIFFVISGYLITGIILREISATKKFLIKKFFERRIRRILPVLFFILIITYPMGYFFMSPEGFLDYSKSVIFSLGFTSNFYFFKTESDYYAFASALIPLLHTWSLSIEEQFYILFPLLFLSKNFREKKILLIIFIIFLISFFLSIITSINFQSLNFYLLPTRAWELLAGSMISFYEIKKKNFNIQNNFLSILSFFLIIFLILFYNENIFNKSIFNILIVLSSCLFLLSKKNNFIKNKILSNKFIVSIGLISYSLYLIHYPILSFSRIIEFTQGDILKKLFLIIIIIILSIISYFLVEKPFRDKNINFKNILIILIFSFTLILSINIFTASQNGFEKRFYYSEKYKLHKISYQKEHNNFLKSFNYDNYTTKENILVVGNSHGEDFLKILINTKFNDQFYFNLASSKFRGNNRPLQIIEFYNFLTDRKRFIKIRGEQYFSNLLKQYINSKKIILSSRYSHKDIKILNNLINILKKDKKIILIVNNSLEMKYIKVSYLGYNFNNLDFFVYKNKKLPNEEQLMNIEKEMYKQLDNRKEINLELKKIANSNDVFLLEKKEIVCNTSDKTCSALTKNGYKIYWDYAHLTNNGAIFFGKKLEKNKLFLEFLFKL